MRLSHLLGFFVGHSALVPFMRPGLCSRLVLAPFVAHLLLEILAAPFLGLRYLSGCPHFRILYSSGCFVSLLLQARAC